MERISHIDEQTCRSLEHGGPSVKSLGGMMTTQVRISRRDAKMADNGGDKNLGKAIKQQGL